MKYLKIFKKYIENKASPEEIRSLSNWLNETDTDNEKLQGFIDSEWDDYVNADGKNAPELETILENINEEINHVGSKIDDAMYKHNHTRNRSWVYVGTAAAAIILVCTFLWINNSNYNKVEKQEYLTEVKSNPKGQKSTIVLRDGSRVKLNADSELSFPETFEKNKRIVYLKGEAFFEVAKDASRPFTVVTGKLATTALGTSFNVKAFPQQKDVKVTLATGKVQVVDQERGIDNQVFLVPNEQATFGKLESTLVKSQLDISESLAWKEGILIFRDADLSEVKERLERWFNVQVTVNNAARWGERSFTGQFDNESLEHVIKGMSYASQFDYSIEGRTVTINL